MHSVFEEWRASSRALGPQPRTGLWDIVRHGRTKEARHRVLLILRRGGAASVSAPHLLFEEELLMRSSVHVGRWYALSRAHLHETDMTYLLVDDPIQIPKRVEGVLAEASVNQE